jgi:hypothetical protein
MTTTPKLGLPHLQLNSSQPEVPANALANGLDKAGNTKLPWTITGNTVTQGQLASAALLGGTPGAGFNFDLPANVARLFAVKNDSS